LTASLHHRCCSSIRGAHGILKRFALRVP
jgi:hypothetical protein